MLFIAAGLVCGCSSDNAELLDALDIENTGGDDDDDVEDEENA